METVEPLCQKPELLRRWNLRGVVREAGVVKCFPGKWLPLLARQFRFWGKIVRCRYFGEVTAAWRPQNAKIRFQCYAISSTQHQNNRTSFLLMTQERERLSSR